MDIKGMGTAIVECPRIGRMIEHHGELFLRRIYTDREIRFGQSRKHAIGYFAGRWAAKEAILKALGAGPSREVAWTEVEVRNAPGGQFRVLVAGRAKEVAIRLGIGDLMVSIAQCRLYATAHALALHAPGKAGQAQGDAVN